MVIKSEEMIMNNKKLLIIKLISPVLIFMNSAIFPLYKARTGRVSDSRLLQRFSIPITFRRGALARNVRGGAGGRHFTRFEHPRRNEIFRRQDAASKAR